MKLSCDPTTCPHDCLGLGYCVVKAERELGATIRRDQALLIRTLVMALAVVFVICALAAWYGAEDDDGRDDDKHAPEPPPPDGDAAPLPPKLEPEVARSLRDREPTDA